MRRTLQELWLKQDYEFHKLTHERYITITLHSEEYKFIAEKVFSNVLALYKNIILIQLQLCLNFKTE